MQKLITAMGALCAMAACAAASVPPAPVVGEPPATQALVEPVSAARNYPSMSCDVRARPTRNGVEIRAFAHAGRAFSGAYDLVVTKIGAAGSSDITQSGPVSLRAGENARVGVAELSMERGAHYRARLIVSDEDGETCRAVARD